MPMSQRRKMLMKKLLQIQRARMKKKKVKAAGGVVFKITPSGEFLVLLIYRNGVWDIPKGKHEKGESISMCAVREVSEETGSLLPLIVSDLGTTYHEYEMKGKQYAKTTWWYSMVFSRDVELVPQTEEGIEKIEWVVIEKAIQQVGYENLVQVLNRFKEAHL